MSYAALYNSPKKFHSLIPLLDIHHSSSSLCNTCSPSRHFLNPEEPKSPGKSRSSQKKKKKTWKMGIKDLLRYMKPFIEPIHIKKYAGKRVKTRHFPQNFQRIYPFFFNNFFYKIESHLLLISAFF